MERLCQNQKKIKVYEEIINVYILSRKVFEINSGFLYIYIYISIQKLYTKIQINTKILYEIV